MGDSGAGSGAGTRLLVLVDTSVPFWKGQDGGDRALESLALPELVKHLHAFLNAFLLTHRANEVGIIATHDTYSAAVPLPALGGRCVHTAAREDGGGVRLARGGGETLLQELAEGLASVIEGAADVDVPVAGPAISASFSRALCILNRARSKEIEDRGAMRRILFLQGAKESPLQYVQIMNAIFCAQRMDVMVDVCMLGRSDSSLLQQAAVLTGGTYANPYSDAEGGACACLSQFLACVLLADRATRGALQQPKPRTSALKVTCFLTKKKIDVGFVCSVCLSIFSTRMASCATCGTTFMTTKALKKRTLAKESKSGAS